jgi:hypothetical protein
MATDLAATDPAATDVVATDVAATDRRATLVHCTTYTYVHMYMNSKSYILICPHAVTYKHTKRRGIFFNLQF